MRNEEVREFNKQIATEALLDSMLVNGITATTKEVVSRMSGLSMTSMARYFPTKDSMVMAAIGEIGKRNADCCREIHKGGCSTGLEKLTAFMDSMLIQYLENPGIYALSAEIICYARHAQKEALSEILNTMGCRRQLLSIFNSGIEDGTLRCEWSPEEEMEYISHLLFGYMSSVSQQHDLTVPEEKDHAENVIRQMFARTYERYIMG